MYGHPLDGSREESEDGGAVSLAAGVPGAVGVLSRGQRRGGQGPRPEAALRLSGKLLLVSSNLNFRSKVPIRLTLKDT